ncbi:MAG TPA: preprotein translocase subunit YajC, partial [Calditrichia bacterium]|nr:preprotein translocase subunit YajC [Calditrichia bacterium]
GMFLYFGLIFLIFYFFIIRPQSKQRKDREKMLSNIEKGANVVTVGGVHGKVIGFKNEGEILIVKVDDNVKLNIEKSAIASLKGEKAEES